MDMLARAQLIAPELTKLRRAIHLQPELSFQEMGTAKFVAGKLLEIGYKPRLVANGIGVLAEIGEDRGPVVAIRADMDGLPIEETNAVDYCSATPGVMHACGHDAHTACLLGAAILLAEEHAKNKLPGRVRLIFQPAEETVNDDGKSGASLVMADGALQDAKCALALHVFPALPTGAIALKSGPLLAACDTFKILIKGVGTHGAFPELGVDAIVLASHVVQAVQTVISRRKSALEPAIVTIGGIKSSTHRPNIVSEEVEIIGTTRYFNADVGASIREEMTRCCRIAEAMGGSFELQYTHDTPALNNDPEITELVRNAALRIMSEDRIIAAPMEMGAEDFSFISNAVPACFIVLGAAIENDPRKLHTSTFDIDERALPLGAAILAQSALECMTRSR